MSDETTIGAARTTPAARATRGDLVDHFIVLDELGRGGAGVVVAAYDPSLDRKVALKLLAPARPGADRDALLAEAQALAKLSDPHVVAVHEVGVAGDRVFIAMELIEGVTLEAWMGAERRPRKDVVDAFVAAGRGLAAVHRAGLIHGDFKPRNVMIGQDGRVRLVDFGLARTATILAGDDGASPSGTPRYMSPEQQRGEPAAARSDQFSFCVALYEAVTGTLPPRNGREPPRGEVPRWLFRILRRGLCGAPEGRFPSMDVLVAELSRDRRARRRRLIAAAAALFALGGAIWCGRQTRPTVAACPDPSRALIGVWDSAHRERVANAVAESESLQASARVVEAIDRHVARWVAMRRRACVATRVDRVQSEHLLELANLCFDEQLATVAAVAAVLDEGRLQRGQAVQAARSLPDLDTCVDRTWLLARVKPPSDPRIAAATAEVRNMLARARALFWAGRYEPALGVARQAYDRALGVEYEPVRAEAASRLGHLLAWTGDPGAARRVFAEAIQRALRSGHYEVAARAWDVLIHVLGVQLGDKVAAYEAAGNAEAILAGLPGDETVLASVVGRRGVLRASDFDYEGALADLRRSLEIRLRRLGVNHPDTAFSEYFLGEALLDHGDHGEALEHARRADDLFRDLSTEHPMRVRAAILTARCQHRLGRPADAVEELSTVIPVLEAALGRDPFANGADAHLALAAALRDLGRRDEALAHYGNAIDELVAHAGERDRRVIIARSELGETLIEAGRASEAEALVRQAVALGEVALAEDADLSVPLAALGSWHRARGEPARALALFERALALRQRSPQSHPLLCDLVRRIAVLRAHLRRPPLEDRVVTTCARSPG